MEIDSENVISTRPRRRTSMREIQCQEKINTRKKPLKLQSVEEYYTDKDLSKLKPSPLQTIFEVPKSSRNNDTNNMGARKIKRLINFQPYYTPSKSKIKQRHTKAKQMQKKIGMKIPTGKTISDEAVSRFISSLSSDEDLSKNISPIKIKKEIIKSASNIVTLDNISIKRRIKSQNDIKNVPTNLSQSNEDSKNLNVLSLKREIDDMTTCDMSNCQPPKRRGRPPKKLLNSNPDSTFNLPLLTNETTDVEMVCHKNENPNSSNKKVGRQPKKKTNKRRVSGIMKPLYKPSIVHSPDTSSDSLSNPSSPTAFHTFKDGDYEKKENDSIPNVLMESLAINNDDIKKPTKSSRRRSMRFCPKSIVNECDNFRLQSTENRSPLKNPSFSTISQVTNSLEIGNISGVSSTMDSQPIINIKSDSIIQSSKNDAMQSFQTVINDNTTKSNLLDEYSYNIEKMEVENDVDMTPSSSLDSSNCNLGFINTTNEFVKEEALHTSVNNAKTLNDENTVESKDFSSDLKFELNSPIINGQFGDKFVVRNGNVHFNK